jgi:hypothetical protein
MSESKSGMASVPSNDASASASAETENEVPSSVIAQAEAAIAGNIDEEDARLERRASRASKLDYSQYQRGPLSRQATSR